MKINKGCLFFIESNLGSGLFEVVEARGKKVFLKDAKHVYEIDKSTLSTYEFLAMGVVYLGRL